MPPRRYPGFLLGAFLALTAGLAWHPPGGMANWVMGNIPVLVVLPVAAWAVLRFRLSAASCTFLFLFFTLHEVGVHYGYRVPWPWVEADRNQYDRLMHAAMGLLLTRPVHEAVLTSGKARGGWALCVAGALLLAGAAIYEVGEWVGAELFWTKGAADFLGFQGDPLDTTKDLAAALAGTLVALAALAAGMLVRARPAQSTK